MHFTFACLFVKLACYLSKVQILLNVVLHRQHRLQDFASLFGPFSTSFHHIFTMDTSNQSISLDDIEAYLSRWYSRAVLLRTSWLYRVDTLRPNDLTYLNTLQDMIVLLRDYAS